jgi:hypothetical protein
MTTIEISKRNIDANSLRDYTKVPLPDFAIQALKKNGFDYDSTSTNANKSQHDVQQQAQQCKLSEHLQCLKSHIDKDGSRLWASSVDTNVRHEFHRQRAERADSSA